MAERVGGGPNGKWPVVSCPVGRCGAMVETAVSLPSLSTLSFLGEGRGGEG